MSKIKTSPWILSLVLSITLAQSGAVFAYGDNYDYNGGGSGSGTGSAPQNPSPSSTPGANQAAGNLAPENTNNNPSGQTVPGQATAPSATDLKGGLDDLLGASPAPAHASSPTPVALNSAPKATDIVQRKVVGNKIFDTTADGQVFVSAIQSGKKIPARCDSAEECRRLNITLSTGPAIIPVKTQKISGLVSAVAAEAAESMGSGSGSGKDNSDGGLKLASSS